MSGEDRLSQLCSVIHIFPPVSPIIPRRNSLSFFFRRAIRGILNFRTCRSNYSFFFQEFKDEFFRDEIQFIEQFNRVLTIKIKLKQSCNSSYLLFVISISPVFLLIFMYYSPGINNHLNTISFRRIKIEERAEFLSSSPIT